MKVSERALQLLSDKGLTQVALADALGLRTSTVNYWFSQGGEIPTKYIVPVCNFIGTSPNNLFTGVLDPSPEPEQELVPANEPDLSEDEFELLHIYQNLDREGKTMVLATAYGQRTRLAQQGNGSNTATA